MPRRLSIIWATEMAHYMLQTHRDTASPEYKGIQINRNYIPVGLGDKFNIRTEQQVNLGLLDGRRVDQWWLNEWRRTLTAFNRLFLIFICHYCSNISSYS